MNTTLIYLDQMHEYSAAAQVRDVLMVGGRNIIILDQTIFYPQGGGQPYDTGVIATPQARFEVNEVRLVEGVVHHIGTYEGGSIAGGETVECLIDKERREENTRIHSAGHLLDMSLKRLGISWIPGKGYHFPQGPYVEYCGSLEGQDIALLKIQIEESCAALIQENVETRVLRMPKEAMHTVCEFVPDYIPADKPARVVMYGDFGIPCGGTHVRRLGDIGKLTIRKIKQEKENIRISYAVG
jgi:alanyl-tRNA synthetase